PLDDGIDEIRNIASSEVHQNLNGEQRIILGDRTNTILEDLVGIRNSAAIAEKNRTSELLIEHQPHLALHPGDDVEVRDVENIVTVELLLLVDGLRAGFTTSGTVELFLLLFTRDVTLRTSIVVREIRPVRLDAAEGALTRSRENRVHPLLTTSVELRSRGKCLGLGKERVDLIDAVRQCIVLNSRFQR